MFAGICSLLPLFSHVSFLVHLLQHPNKQIHYIEWFFHFSRSLIEHFRRFCFAFVSTSLLFVTFAKIKEKKRKKKRRSSGSQNDVVLFWSSANLFEVAMANRSKRTEGSIDYNETTCCECHTYFTRLPLQWYNNIRVNQVNRFDFGAILWFFILQLKSLLTWIEPIEKCQSCCARISLYKVSLAERAKNRLNSFGKQKTLALRGSCCSELTFEKVTKKKKKLEFRKNDGNEHLISTFDPVFNGTTFTFTPIYMCYFGFLALTNNSRSQTISVLAYYFRNNYNVWLMNANNFYVYQLKFRQYDLDPIVWFSATHIFCFLQLIYLKHAICVGCWFESVAINHKYTVDMTRH